jgi:hypothetical protein
MDDFELTSHDRSSSLWVRLEAHLVEMVAAARRKNDDETITEQQTAALRGRIKCLKSLIALGADRPTVTGAGDDGL